MSLREFSSIQPFYYAPHKIDLDINHLAALLPKDMLRLVYGYHLPVRVMQEYKPKNTLNMGDYTSFANIWLAQLTEKFYSIDIDPQMLRNHGVPTRRAYGLENTYLSSMDIRAMAFPDNFFDMGIFIEVAGTSKSTGMNFVAEAMPEIHRVLQPGSHLIMNHMSASGQALLQKHPYYQALRTDLNNGFPNFRGIPLSNDFLAELIEGKFQIVGQYGQIPIDLDKDLPLMRTVEDNKVQYHPDSLELIPFEQLSISDRCRPLYWYLDLVKI